MSWKTILKVDMQEANRLGRKYAMDDPDMRDKVFEEAEEKAKPILDTIMNGIDILETEYWSPKDSFSGEELKMANNTFAYAISYDTIFGQVDLSVGVNGEVYDGYFGSYGEDTANNKLMPGTPIDMAKAKKINKDMAKQQEREYAGETQRSQIGYAETPDEYYYFGLT